MALTKIQFAPGVNKEGTEYSADSGWFDSDKVRFRKGRPEKIGGWRKFAESFFLGVCRSIHDWASLESIKYIGLGTNLKFYIAEGNNFNDVTPIRLTTSAGDVTFAAVNGSSTLTVTDTAHGAVVNDFVTYTDAATLGGNITAVVLNQEYQILSVPTTSTYTITAKDTDGNAVTANASDSGNGGSSTVGAYQINTGLNTFVDGTGWGAGTWGSSTWGSSSAVSAAGQLRLWNQDNFGEDLLINVRDGGIFYWDRSATDAMTTPAVALGDIAGANAAPTVAKIIKVSDRDRHVIVFGCDPSSSTTQDPLLIRFSSIESVTDWLPTATNDAGSLKLGTGSEIVSALETRQQILVFTDVSLHAMQYLGPPFTFGINLISQNITIMGPLSAIAVDDSVFWMGAEEFYVYNGSVQRLPCTVRDYIFNDFNSSQAEKVTAGINSSYGEVWWFYPSGTSNEVDSYVVYNYQQQIWYYGSLTRTAWVDRGINSFPISAGTDHYLYNHELGLDDGSTEPASSISCFIESSQLDIGEGDRFSFISKLIPDLTFRDSTATSPTATFTLETRNFPGGAYLQSNDSSVVQTSSATATVVEQFTDQVNLRLRGRSFAVKIASGGEGVTWRLGSPRVDIRPDGRR